MTKIHHHVDDSTLMSYASGSLPEALAAVVKTHLSVCSECKEKMKDMRLIGSALLDKIEPEPMRDRPSAASLFCNGDSHDVIAKHCGPINGKTLETNSDVPTPLQPFIGTSLDNIKWKRLGYGIWHAPIGPDSPEGRGDLRLIKVAPGQVLPQHTHGGTELTIVLQGSYRDEVARFGVYDVEDVDCETEHQPISDPETGCICLIASERPAKYKSLVPRLVQPITGL